LKHVFHEKIGIFTEKFDKKENEKKENAVTNFNLKKRIDVKQEDCD